MLLRVAAAAWGWRGVGVETRDDPQAMERRNIDAAAAGAHNISVAGTRLVRGFGGKTVCW